MGGAWNGYLSSSNCTAFCRISCPIRILQDDLEGPSDTLTEHDALEQPSERLIQDPSNVTYLRLMDAVREPWLLGDIRATEPSRNVCRRASAGPAIED